MNPNDAEASRNDPEADTAPVRRGGLWRAAGAVLTVFSVLAGSAAAFVVTSGLVTIVAMAIVVGPFDLASLQDPDAMAQVVRSRIGFPLVVVIPQFALIVLPLAVVVLSRSSTRRGLGLVRGHWPLWAWLAAGLAVPLVGMVSGVVSGFFFEESDHLRVMTEIFREHGRGGFLIPLALMIGLTPAICEELLFRGFAQTRLTRSLGPVAAIVLVSITFAAFHWDPVHAVAVFPIGLFLGLISWRSGSLFPAMLGHFMNNVISVAAVTMAPEDASDVLELPGSILLVLGVFSAGLIGIGAVVAASVLYGRPDPIAHAEHAHAENAHAENAHAENAHAENAHAENAHAENAHAENVHAENPGRYD